LQADSEKESGDRLKLYRRVNLFFGVFMSSFYLAAGTFLILYPLESEYLTTTRRHWFGALLIVYGIFRMFRYFNRRKAGDTINL
jgi:uncharacterized membrane protein HdeD (DUF308 family)